MKGWELSCIPKKYQDFSNAFSSVSFIPLVPVFVCQDRPVPSLLFCGFPGMSMAIWFLFALKEAAKFKLFKSSKRQKEKASVPILVVIIASIFNAESFSAHSVFANCSVLCSESVHAGQGQDWSHLYCTENQCFISLGVPLLQKKGEIIQYSN